MFRRTKVCTGLMLAFGGSLALGSLPALAQQQMEKVEITGSSIKRIDAETALPVQVLTREDIARTGATTVEQLLQTVSAVSSSGGLTASSGSGATTGGISSTSLRGLTSTRTLVLLNGRRIAPYGIGFTNDSVSVDVNSIPLSAIERVEVLKDGASAVYGSDAIAGVINFILKRDFEGTEISAEYGTPTRGSAANSKRASISWGKGNLSTDRYNVMLVGSFQKESALYGRDRDFASHSYNVANQVTTTSGNTFPANVASVPGTPAASVVSGNPTNAQGCVPPYSSIDPVFGPGVCRFDPASMVALLPDSERTSIFGSAKFQLSDNIEGFVEASFNKNKTNTIIQPVPLSDQFTIPLNNPLANQAPYNQYTTFPSSTIILKPGTPYYPTAWVQSKIGTTAALPDLRVRYRAALSGNRDLTDTAEAPRLTFGVKGSAAGWDFDVAALHSQSKVRETINDGYPIYSKILPLLNSGTVNFFGDNTADTLAQIRAANFNGDAFKVTSTLQSLSGHASREIAQLDAGAVSVAVGAEFRKEKYKFDPSQEIAQGDISGYGGNLGAVDKSRNVTSVFGELVLPIVKNLEADAAVRYDKYEGSGNSTTPKLSLRWQPSSQFLMRGSVSKGFRAPSLADLYSPSTTGVSQTGLTDPVRCPVTGDGVKDCETQFPTTNGGKTTLSSEKSTNFTTGIVLEPTKNFSASLDYFHIKLKDTISNGLPQAVILGNLAKYGSYVTRGPDEVVNGVTIPGAIINIDQTNLNTGETKLSGLDIDLKWRLPTAGFGRFTLGFSGTYFIKYDTQNPDGTFSPNVGNLENATTGGVIPRLKTYQFVNWANGPWDVTLGLNWQSGYHDVPGSDADGNELPRRVSPYEIYDAQVTWSGIKGLRLTLGAKNLMDADPPYTNQSFSFQSGYDPQYADPRGRFVYVRAAYAF